MPDDDPRELSPRLIDPEQLAILRERIGAVLAPVDKRAQRAIEQLANQLRSSVTIDVRVVESFKRATVPTELAEQFRRTWRDAQPANWRDLTTDEITAAIDMAISTGIAVVWTPSPEIVRALIAADDDIARERTLVDRGGDILDDLTATLADATHPSLGHLPAAAQQAIDAFGDGHHGPAQSHAAAALSGMVHRHFNYRYFSDARTRFQRDHPDHVALTNLRMTTLLHAFARALTKTEDAAPGFNRHATLHEVPGEQHTRANAIISLLLLVGLLRELSDRFEYDSIASTDQ